MNTQRAALGASLKNAACLRLPADGRVRWSKLHGDLARLRPARRWRLRPKRLIEGETDRRPSRTTCTRTSTARGWRRRWRTGWACRPWACSTTTRTSASCWPNTACRPCRVGRWHRRRGPGHFDGSAWGGEVLQVSPEGWRREPSVPTGLPGGDCGGARALAHGGAAALHAMGRGGEIAARFDTPLAKGGPRCCARLNCAAHHQRRPLVRRRGGGGLGICRLEAQAPKPNSGDGVAGRRPRPGCESPATPASTNGRSAGSTCARCWHACSTTRDAGEGAALFHGRPSRWRAPPPPGPRTVALGGGCFFNRLLALRRVRPAAHAASGSNDDRPAGRRRPGPAAGAGWPHENWRRAAMCLSPSGPRGREARRRPRRRGRPVRRAQDRVAGAGARGAGGRLRDRARGPRDRLIDPEERRRARWPPVRRTGGQRRHEVRRRVPRRRRGIDAHRRRIAADAQRRAGATASWSSAAATHAIARYGVGELLPPACA